jgi:splicing factor 3A subunit 3
VCHARLAADSDSAIPARSYVQSLHDYLVDFYKRALPLENLDAELVKVDAAFEHEWQAGTLPGWEKDDEGESSSALFCVACMRLRAVRVR